MFQREMAARIISPPGSKGYGVISVLTQAFYSGESLMQIKPGAFHPPPKVHSMVIRLTRKDDIEHIPYKVLRRIVKAAFGQRRKKLSNALKGVVPKEMLADFNLLDERAEQVPVDVFIEMAVRLAVGCWLLAVGCWLLAVGCWLLAVGCWLLANNECLSQFPNLRVSPQISKGKPMAVGCWPLAVGRWPLAVKISTFYVFLSFLAS